MSKLITKKEIDKLEDQNQHGRVAIELVKSFGSYQEYLTIMKICRNHDKRGYIEHEEQKIRDQIIFKYYDYSK